MTLSIPQILLVTVTSCATLLAGFSSPSVAAASEAALATEEIPLWPATAPGSEGYEGKEVYNSRSDGAGWINGVSRPTMTIYMPATESRNGTGVVICPGGGYGGLAIDHEGHAMAEWFAERGVLAAVLKYRHGGGQHQHPVPLSDAQRALRMMRSRADQWQLQNNQIGIVGFSAGGHLASTAGTRFDQGQPNAEDPIQRESCQANFMVLGYPVISMQAGITHQGSKKNLLGETPTEDLVELFSNELQVSEETGPTFLVHAADDMAVPVANSLRFYQALIKHNVPAEMHLYEKGGHGFGLFRGDRPADHWPELLEGWLKGRGLLH